MPRRTATILIAGLLSLGVTLSPGSAPVSASAPSPATTSSAAPAAPAMSWPYGRSYAPDQVLRRGRGEYRIKWNVKPPTREWSAIVKVFGAGGRRVADFLLDANAPDPRRGSGTFVVYRSSVDPGRWRTSMRVVWTDSSGERRSRQTRPTYFRMSPPR